MEVDLQHLFIGLASGSVLGFLICLLVSIWSARRLKELAQRQADDLMHEAQTEARTRLESAESKWDAHTEEALEELHNELRPRRENVDRRTEELQELQTVVLDQMQDLDSQIKKKQSQIQSISDRTKNFEARVESVRHRLQTTFRRLVEALRARNTSSEEDLKREIQNELIEEFQVELKQRLDEYEVEVKLNSERSAKRIIRLALNRFARPYCPERGIGNVQFGHAENMNRVLGQNRENLALIEKEIGVDFVIHTEYFSASVMGFDPVRREWGRLTLEKLVREKRISPDLIQQTLIQTKKDLFKRIFNDGQRIAQELKIPDFHADVRSMLGALRYRYSFSQNQYFHVAEVGWLCGLLSGELGLSITDGRRAGVLHDIGKAMDHSIEGGHAVIGADFIEKHGEAPHIVHAVRAHHYDEQPGTELAFLTIAADALSGARPGARRSTVDSYTQKMADLEKIGSGFDGVIATYVLSAGRELRVIVDAHKVNDHKAMELAAEIAHKIEQELNYPGFIKVTVVRETQAVEMAR